MKVTARLTWIEEKILEKLLGNASLTLLYQSSAHKNCVSEMTQKYSLQGSTMTVFHLEKDVVVGVFILENFPRLVSEKPCTCAWFSLKRNNSSGISALFLNTKVIVDSEELIIFSLDGLSLSVTPLRGFTLALNDTVMNGLELNLGHGFLPVECEIFRVDGIKKNPSFIKKMVTAEQHRGKLLSALRAYKPYKDLVSEVRILLVGPVGSGKSSFFNSVKSAFQGHLTRQAIVGSDESSITKQFNPCEPMKPKHSPHAASPPLKDRIHCVAFVLHINSVNTLSDKMVAKLKKIRKDVVDCGIGYVALLTNVEEYDEVLDDSFANMTETVTSLSQVQNVQKWLNIPIANILMVSNYASERRLEPMKDILVFAALRQMLRAADDALEDLPLEDTGNLAPF
uniref:Isoform 2 of Interferon-induced protein 44-like n=1 Tax=Mus musculus TaxID=10090 RepID=Q9BDB7-2